MHNGSSKIFKIDTLFLLFITFALMPDIFKMCGINIKPMYLLFLIFLGILIYRRRCILPDKVIIGLFIYSFLISVVAIPFWGIGRRLVNYSFGMVVLVIFCTLGKKVRFERWLIILQKVWLIVVVAVCINNLVHYKVFREYFYLKLNHPALDTLIVGGVNIEASWIAMLTLAFGHRKDRIVPLVVSCFFSLLYASRCGIIADFLVAVFFIYGSKPYEKLKKRITRGVLCSCIGFCAIVVLFLVPISSDLLLKVFSRITEIGHDPGSLGRFAMWKYIPALICMQPFGVGLGNAMKGISKISPLVYEENNVHCVIIQMFCEIGIIGGILYISAWWKFLIKNIKSLFKNPLIQILFIYLVLSLVQFGGGETIFFCMLGIYLVTNKYEMRGMEINGK